MRQTPVYIICSPRPLVGKTLIARLLSEFLLLKDGKVLAFDVNLNRQMIFQQIGFVQGLRIGEITSLMQCRLCRRKRL